jgi:hypothetical protein
MEIVDPVLGAICPSVPATATSTGRPAGLLHVKHGQPVFDIALLGAMKVTRQRDGTPQLHIPAVGARNTGIARCRHGSDKGDQSLMPGDAWLGLGWDYVGLAGLGDAGRRLVDRSPKLPQRICAAGANRAGAGES